MSLPTAHWSEQERHDRVQLQRGWEVWGQNLRDIFGEHSSFCPSPTPSHCHVAWIIPGFWEMAALIYKG